VNQPRGAQIAIAPNRQQRRQTARQEKKAQRGAGGGGAKPELDRMLGQALAQQKSGRHRDALHIFHQILTRQPDHLETLNCAGLAAYHMGDCNLAIQFLQAAINRKPDFAEAHSNLGSAFAIAGRMDESLAAYRRAIEIAPSYAIAHYNLGAIFQATGRFEASAAAYRKAIALRPDHIETYTNLATVQYEIGDLGAMETTCRKAIALQPNDPLARTTLGLALLSRGARDEAEAALHQAVEVDSSFGRAHYYLGHILFREHDLQPAARCFEEALRADPTLGKVHLFLGIIDDLLGKAEAAARHFDALAHHSEETDHLIDSWTYVKSSRAAGTRLFSDSFETLKYALDCAQVVGLAAEFGVRFGTSLNFLAGQLAQEVHGFDSFQGLPEAWDGVEPGLYTTGGKLPQVGPNVRLHVGLFAHTLPDFAAEHPGPIRFMNVDCDIYSSTKTIFDQLADRIVPGTVIVFDEYLMNPNWRDDEFKAFQEAVQEHGWKYEYLAFNLFTKQAVVRIL
jgi:tetratricopeptide (TPR) repeat protein